MDDMKAPAPSGWTAGVGLRQPLPPGPVIGTPEWWDQVMADIQAATARLRTDLEAWQAKLS